MTGRLMLRWRVAAAVLLVLLALDAVDVGLYLAHILALRGDFPAWFRPRVFNMNVEFGLGEIVEYAKSLACAVALAICAHRSRERIFAAVGGIHLWMALDNALRFHEQLGVLVGRGFLRDETWVFTAPGHAGEFLVFLAIGATAALLVVAALRRTGREMLPTARILGAAVFLPAVFGVFVDALHGSQWAHHLPNTLWVILEDGGETAMLSLNCALALACLAYASHPAAGPRQQVQAPG